MCTVMVKKNEKAKASDLGALQVDFEKKHKVANAASKALERAQDAADRALHEEGAAEQALKNATRSVLGLS